jgi:FixJ family two-component response regulator
MNTDDVLALGATCTTMHNGNRDSRTALGKSAGVGLVFERGVQRRCCPPDHGINRPRPAAQDMTIDGHGPKEAAQSIVFVVDDDPSVRESLQNLMESCGLRTITFESAGQYSAYSRPNVPSCLILDMILPDITGLDFQKRVAGTNHPPIVFITGRGDIPTSVRAMKLGAIDFLTKPVSEDDILNAVQDAIARDAEALLRRAALVDLQQRYSLLTTREREVLPLVIGGLLNKQAGTALGISESTLQIHRRNIMQKMEADSLAELVRMAMQLKVPLPQMRRRGAVATDLVYFALPHRYS